MNKIGRVRVGGTSPVRIMGILNVSPESFYKKSVKKGAQVRQAVSLMESGGADLVDVGGMSTAPYLSTLVSERRETERVISAIRQIQRASNLPISVDTCRAGVARAALEEGAEILNDISGLKYDPQMPSVLERFAPSVILCAYSNSQIRGNLTERQKTLLKQSIAIARGAGIRKDQIVLDPAIGFFRKGGKNPFYTRTRGDWLAHDLDMLQNIASLKMSYPVLVSPSNKSFIGRILESKDPADRLLGSLTSEAVAVLNGADIVRTHNVRETREVILTAEKIRKTIGKGL